MELWDRENGKGFEFELGERERKREREGAISRRGMEG